MPSATMILAALCALLAAALLFVGYAWLRAAADAHAMRERIHKAMGMLLVLEMHLSLLQTGHSQEERELAGTELEPTDTDLEKEEARQRALERIERRIAAYVTEKEAHDG